MRRNKRRIMMAVLHKRNPRKNKAIMNMTEMVLKFGLRATLRLRQDQTLQFTNMMKSATTLTITANDATVSKTRHQNAQVDRSASGTSRKSKQIVVPARNMERIVMSVT